MIVDNRSITKRILYKMKQQPMIVQRHRAASKNLDDVRYSEPNKGVTSIPRNIKGSSSHR